MLPLLPLVDKRKEICLRKPRVLLALAQTLLTCIPSQIICDSDPPPLLDVFDIFEDCSLQSIWSVALFDPFLCYFHHITFKRLKFHPPFSCPAYKSIYTFLKFHCVFCILNFSVANTVIRKESYFRINICWDIINVQRKQQGTKDSTLWDTRENRDPIRFCSVYNNSLTKQQLNFSSLWHSQCAANGANFLNYEAWNPSLLNACWG